MNVWLISTSGRRGRLRSIFEEGGHHLQNAEAVMIRADLLDAVSRAAKADDTTVVLDAVSLDINDVTLAIKKLRETNANAPIALIVLEQTQNQEEALKAFALTKPYSILFDASEAFESELLEAIAQPQSSATASTSKKRRGLFRRKQTASQNKQKQGSNSETTPQKPVEAQAEKEPTNRPVASPSFARRFFYALADNARIIFVSLLLTVAATVVYYAVAQKGLTFGEISSYISETLTGAFTSFFSN